MKFPRLTQHRLTKRLRWVMVGVIVSDAVNTVMGQPESYWLRPAMAVEHNKFVRPFVAQGAVPFLCWALLYVVGAFLLVSILPRRLALAALLSFILGHYFGASTWWVYRWGYGMQASIIYGIIIAVVLVLCGVGAPHPGRGRGEDVQG